MWDVLGMEALIIVLLCFQGKSVSVSELTLIILQDVVGFLLSPEAERLRPLLVQELVTGLDYYTRDRLQRAYNSLPSLAPRLPFLGPLPLPLPLTSLPVFIPGLGLQPVQQLVQRLAPPLMQTEEVYLQSLLEVAAGLLGMCCAVLCCAVLCCAVLHSFVKVVAGLTPGCMKHPCDLSGQE